MNSVSKGEAILLPIIAGLAACSGGSNTGAEAPIDTDYSALRIAESREGALAYANEDEQVLRPLRNGLRMSLGSGPAPAAAVPGVTAPNADGLGSYSGTTVQVEGVDEADLVKYDGRYIYIVRPEPAPPSLTAPIPEMTRNVLKIVRTHPATASVEVVSGFDIEGQQSTLPLIYQVQNEGGETQYIAAVTQHYQGWSLMLPQASALVVQPDRTTLQLLDVSDPYNVSQTWKMELDGWLRASRKIDDALYLVSSYRPRLPGLVLPADAAEKKQANERLIRSAAAADLLPRYRENGGAERPLATPGDCVIAANLRSHEAYTDLIVVTAIDLSERRVTDVNCISSNINGVYMSLRSLYVGGEGRQSPDGSAQFTVLHKFGLDDGDISYRASGAVAGRIGWANASYFMDERESDLRILTTQHISSGDSTHHLNVLRETTSNALALLSVLPNSEHPAPIGKPREQVHAVRFVDDRAYVVTARVTDPLYVIDLSDPTDPAIAGELEIPGFSTYLQQVGPAGSQLLLSIGQQTNAAGVRQGVKVELFDVHDIARPRSIGVELFGEAGSSSEAVGDPHALTFMSMPGTAARHRLALPIDVFDTADPIDANRFLWTYSGLHLLEISGLETAAPQLRFQGVIRTDEPSTVPYPTRVVPDRSVMHDDAVFAIHGESILSSLWQSVEPR